MNHCARCLSGSTGSMVRTMLIEPPIPISIRWDGGSKQTVFTRGSFD
jgi:hypothetical protein